MLLMAGSACFLKHPKDHLPRTETKLIPQVMGAPTPMINPENAPQACLQASLEKTLPQLRFPLFPDISRLVSS